VTSSSRAKAAKPETPEESLSSGMSLSFDSADVSGEIPADLVRASVIVMNDADQLVRRVVADVATAVLPKPSDHPEELDMEVAAALRHFVRHWAMSLRDSRSIRTSELEVFRYNTAHRAEEGVDFSTVLWGQQVFVRALWQMLCSVEPPLSAQSLAIAGDHLLRSWHPLLDQTMTGYFEGFYDIDDRVRKKVTAALLAGHPAEPTADKHGIPLPDRFAVLALELGRHPQEELGDEPDRASAGKRKLRRVLLRLARQLGEQPLSHLDADGGTVLMSMDLSTTAPPWERIDMEDLARSAGASVRAAVVPTSRHDEIPRAAVQAKEILRIATATKEGPGPFTLNDVLVEYHLTRATESAEAIVSSIAPLLLQPSVLETVETYLAVEADRRRAADVLVVHPNTVDNRLARCATLTGLDPRTAAGRFQLQIALTVHRLASAQGRPQ
jgi:hypothetical protein